jgi:hypothetical protein
MTLQIELSCPDRDDPEVPIDGHEVTVGEYLGRLADPVHARNAEFSRDDRPVN